jgi:hypothetical protein
MEAFSLFRDKGSVYNSLAAIFSIIRRYFWLQTLFKTLKKTISRQTQQFRAWNIVIGSEDFWESLARKCRLWSFFAEAAEKL